MTGGRTPAALSIAGSDSSAGAGVQAALKTFSALGVYGATAITAITAQNTLGVGAIHLVPPDIISAQIGSVFGDLNVRAVVTGMLGGEDAIEGVADALEKYARPGVPVVADPVMVSTSGSRLLENGAERLLIRRLIPLASLLTPNLEEAAVLLGGGIATSEAGLKAQAERLHGLGAGAVLLKGGHATGAMAADLFFDGVEFYWFSAPRVATRNTHGTGCTLAAAIAAYLVQGATLRDAIAGAKAYVQTALLRSGDLEIGGGAGPVHHFHASWPGK